MNKLVVVLFLLSFVACTKKTKDLTTGSDVPKTDTKVVVETPSKPESEPNNKSYTMLEIRRTSCFGKCPAYSVKVMSNGIAYYHGVKNVERVGDFEAKIAMEQLQKLVKKAESIKYFEMSERYPLNKNAVIADLPYTYTTVSDGKKEKKVANNYDAPPALLEFEAELDTFFSQIRWERRID